MLRLFNEGKVHKGAKNADVGDLVGVKASMDIRLKHGGYGHSLSSRLTFQQTKKWRNSGSCG